MEHNTSSVQNLFELYNTSQSYLQKEIELQNKIHYTFVRRQNLHNEFKKFIKQIIVENTSAKTLFSDIAQEIKHIKQNNTIPNQLKYEEVLIKSHIIDLLDNPNHTNKTILIHIGSIYEGYEIINFREFFNTDFIDKEKITEFILKINYIPLNHKVIETENQINIFCYKNLPLFFGDELDVMCLKDISMFEEFQIPFVKLKVERNLVDINGLYHQGEFSFSLPEELINHFKFELI